MMLEMLHDGFVRNFITDDRYLFIINGFFTTLKITFFAVLLGIAVGDRKSVV